MCACASTVKKPLSQAGKKMNSAAPNVKISLISTNQEKGKRGTNKFFEKHENAEKICEYRKILLQKFKI